MTNQTKNKWQQFNPPLGGPTYKILISELEDEPKTKEKQETEQNQLQIDIDFTHFF